MYIDEERKPETLGATNFLIALALHLGFFALLWAMGQMAFREKEEVIPIDVTIVVKENLDGKEDELPPLEPPQGGAASSRAEPEPEPARQDAAPPTPQPEAVEKIPVKKLEEKKEPEKKPDPTKKKEPEKKPEPPKKTAAELRAERIKRMQESAVDNKTPPKPVRDGKTGRKTLSDAEIERRLKEGYHPGPTEQLAPNEKTRCTSLIRMALEAKWNQLSPQIGRAGMVHIRIRFDRFGRIVESSLAKSCGDATSDAAAMRVVRSLGMVRGLSTDFLEKYSRETIIIEYKVEGLK